MSGVMTKEENRNLDQRTYQKLLDPNLMEEVHVHVANGGNIIDLCELWGVRWGNVSSFIYQDVGRSERYKTALVAQTEWAIQRVMKEVNKIAHSDVRDAFTDEGCLKNIVSMPDVVAPAIASVEIFEEFSKGKNPVLTGYTKKIKFWDKMKGIELVMKKLGILVERLELSAKITLEQLVEGSIKPVVAVEVKSEKKPETQEAKQLPPPTAVPNEDEL